MAHETTQVNEATKEWDLILIGAELATMIKDAGPYGGISHGAIAIKDGKIAFCGMKKSLPRPAEELANRVINLNGRVVTPGLIDCHTHAVFAGNRSGEFEMRQKGHSYEDIANAGGGILSTVKDTREASLDDLIMLAEDRLTHLMAEGVTTVEIKSGYGLNLETERKMLTAVREIGARNPIRTTTTFLGAHAVPPEFKGDADGYIAHICDAMMPTLHKEGLIDAVDAFCEGIGFSPEQTKTLFQKAIKLDLPIKLHADQLSDLGGMGIIADYKGLSADHVEYSHENHIVSLGKADGVAVLLPAAFYFLHEKQAPNIEKMRKAGVNMALATDMNPGSSPVSSLLTVMNMGCILFGMTPEESLAAVTRNGAKALGMEHDIGTLEVGKCADLAIWNISNPNELSYWVGGNPLAFSLFDGQLQMLADPEFEDLD